MKDTTNAADFNAKLAALKVAANTAAPKSKDANTADEAIVQLFCDEADALQRKYNRLPKDFSMIIQTQWLTHPGKVWKSDMEIGITTIGDIDTFPTEVRFAFKGYDYLDGHWKIFARYRTPAQVEAVIRMIKAAVKRGDTEFKFPTVAKLEHPDEVKPPESKGALRVTFGVNEIFDNDDEDDAELLNEFEAEIRAIGGIISCRIDETVCVICDGDTETVDAVENVLSRYGFRFNRYVWRDERIHTKAAE